MATTMSLIAKQTVGSGGASSVTFSNIPQTFTDLKIVWSGRTTNSATQDNSLINFNGITSGYSDRTLLDAGGSTAASYSSSGTGFIWPYFPAANATANTFGNSEMYIPNYTSSNAKSVFIDHIMENNATTVYSGITAGLWSYSGNPAITSITITGNTAGLAGYSTVYLYGISSSSTQNTSVPYASGGDVIATDGSYWYHAFKYSGSFTPLKALTADVLVVAGGGGGGGNYGAGGGGGAGGLLAFSSQSLTANTGLTCTVGAGGAAGANSPGNATNGNDSQFGALTLVKGGGGAGTYQNNGLTGGSGGGGGGGDASTTGGSATSGQGNSGGGGSSSYKYAGGGGGGAGSAGGNSSAGPTGGNGGAGVNTYSSWATATSTGVSGYYAGGGGGGAGDPSGPYNGTAGTGGSGGGGAGATNSNNGTAGTANTGGGGGGTRQGNGAAGGSGIIIVRYAV